MKQLTNDSNLIISSGLTDLVIQRATKYEPEFFCEVVHILSLIKGSYIFLSCCGLNVNCQFSSFFCFFV